MKWNDDDAVASARFEPDANIAGKIRERMMNCSGERRGPRSLRTLPKDRQRGSWHAAFLYKSNTSRGRAARADAIDLLVTSCHDELPDRLPPLEQDEAEGGDEERATGGVIHGRLPLKRRAQSKEPEATPLQPRPDCR